MTDWTVEEVLKCIKIVLNDIIVVQPSKEDLKKYKETENPEELLQYMFSKSERIGEFYDEIDRFRKDIEHAYHIPELYRYGYDKPGIEIASSFRAEGNPDIYRDEKGNQYISKHNMILMFYDIFDGTPMEHVSLLPFLYWFNNFIRKKYKSLQNSYQLVPYSIVLSMQKSAEKINRVQQEFKGVIREQDVFELRKYFDEEDEHLLVEHFKLFLDKYPISNNKHQAFYKTVYGEIKGTIEKVLKVHENFKDSMEPSKNPLPIVRCFWAVIPGKPEKFYFEKEVFDVIRVLRKDLGDKFQSDGETEEERKLGIVHMMNEQTFVDILEKYKISMLELNPFFATLTIKN